MMLTPALAFDHHDVKLHGPGGDALRVWQLLCEQQGGAEERTGALPECR